MLEFERIIKKHSKTYNITHEEEGHFDGPNWVPGNKTDYQIEAAIFPLNAEGIQRYEGLGYTTKDIKIFIPELTQAYNVKDEIHEEINFRKNDEIEYSGDLYVLDSIQDRTTHSDFVKWIAVRKQDGGDENND